ncbi:LBP/BPI/CETP family domain-containing protein [Dirofilaria immitis]|nr:LBP/BPI/CETP family domain-containing protein [Dirofilaria immitis]
MKDSTTTALFSLSSPSLILLSTSSILSLSSSKKLLSYKTNLNYKSVKKSSTIVISLVIQTFFYDDLITSSFDVYNFFMKPDTYAGFVTRINQRALDLLADYLKERVNQFMQHGEIIFNFSAPLTNEVTFGLISTKAIGYDSKIFKSRLFIIPGQGIIWMGSHLNLSIGTFLNFPVPLVTFMDLPYFKLTAINFDGHLRTDLQKCTLSPGNVIMNFSETDPLLLVNYYSHIDRFISERIEMIICSSFNSELVPIVSNRLMNTPMSAILFDQYFLNYGFIEQIQYLPNAIELKHRGNAFSIVRQGLNRLNDFRLPFSSPPITVDNQEKPTMLEFTMSNYTLASLLYWMDQYRNFDYEISKESMNNTVLVGYLRTESLSTQYPGGIVQIKSHTTTYPRVRFEQNKGVIVIWSQVDAFVQQSERTHRFLTSGMMVELKLEKGIFRNYSFTSEMRIDKFKIFDVISLVDGIDETSLEFLVSALNELLIGDDVARKLSDGIKLPILFDFAQKSADVIFEKIE